MRQEAKTGRMRLAGALLVVTGLAALSAVSARAAYTAVEGGRSATVEFSRAGCGATDTQTTITNPPPGGAYKFEAFGPAVGSVLPDSTTGNPVATVSDVSLVGAPPDVRVSVRGTGAACDPSRGESFTWTAAADYGYFYLVRVLKDCGTVRAYYRERRTRQYVEASHIKSTISCRGARHVAFEWARHSRLSGNPARFGAGFRCHYSRLGSDVGRPFCRSGRRWVRFDAYDSSGFH